MPNSSTLGGLTCNLAGGEARENQSNVFLAVFEITPVLILLVLNGLFALAVVSSLRSRHSLHEARTNTRELMYRFANEIVSDSEGLRRRIEAFGGVQSPALTCRSASVRNSRKLLGW